MFPISPPVRRPRVLTRSLRDCRSNPRRDPLNQNDGYRIRHQHYQGLIPGQPANGGAQEESDSAASDDTDNRGLANADAGLSSDAPQAPGTAVRADRVCFEVRVVRPRYAPADYGEGVQPSDESEAPSHARKDRIRPAASARPHGDAL